MSLVSLRRFQLSFAVLVLIVCSSCGRTETPVPTLVPVAASATFIPSPTLTLEPTVTSTPVSTPVLLPLIFHYEDGVPESQKLAQENAAKVAYIEFSRYADLGEVEIYTIFDFLSYADVLVPIHQADVPTLTYQSLVADWPSSPALGAQNVIVINSGFPTEGNCHRANWIAHELYHYVQVRLMKHPLFRPELDYGPEWIKEGSAQLAAYWVTQIIPECSNQWDWFEQTKIVASVGPLKEFEDLALPGWFAGIYPLAVNYLIGLQPDGEQSLVDFYSEIGNGKRWKDAFEIAFGLSVENFYEKFEEFRHLAYLDAQATEQAKIWIRGRIFNEADLSNSVIHACPVDGRNCMAGTIFPDGRFEIDVYPTSYYLLLNREDGSTARYENKITVTQDDVTGIFFYTKP